MSALVTPTIVTLEEVRDHLGLSPQMSDDSPPVPLDDPDLRLKMLAATEWVCAHISDRQPADPDWIAEIEAWTIDDGSSPSNPAPPMVRLAVLELTADLFRWRGDEEDRNREPGYLPTTVRNLLTRYRDPAVS